MHATPCSDKSCSLHRPTPYIWSLSAWVRALSNCCCTLTCHSLLTDLPLCALIPLTGFQAWVRSKLPACRAGTRGARAAGAELCRFGGGSGAREGPPAAVVGVAGGAGYGVAAAAERERELKPAFPPTPLPVEALPRCFWLDGQCACQIRKRAELRRTSRPARARTIADAE